jgi:hypothetical protein
LNLDLIFEINNLLNGILAASGLESNDAAAVRSDAIGGLTTRKSSISQRSFREPPAISDDVTREDSNATARVQHDATV